MTDAMDTHELEPLDAERVYRNYLGTCRRLGIEPVQRDHAKTLMAEWSAKLADRGAASTTH